MRLGIDLGTTRSVVATVEASGAPMVLPNRLGEVLTPSVVCFESATEVLVGSAARDREAERPDRVVSLIKRQMGTECLLSFDDIEHTPESISALILRALVAGALPGTHAGEPVRAVITVPAYFGIREREATQQAALLAGIEVLELISEPVAAARYYDHLDHLSCGAVLVYDLGGGTFDATVLVRSDQTRVVATDGDTELGGADWDRRLAAYLLSEFVAATGADPSDDETYDTFQAELHLLAERIKLDLSASRSRRVPVRWQDHTAMVEVTREQFEAMTADLLARTYGCLRRLLAAAAGKGVPTIDQVLLVGGSSRMPMVSAGLTEQFGWRPRLHDPDLSVAKGAALRAEELGRPAFAVRRPVASVVPRGFGLLVHDSRYDASGTGQRIEHFIHHNDPLPVEHRECVVATILNGQPSMRIQVYEQAGSVESAAVADNRRVLDGELTGLPASLPAGSPIRVALSLGLDGRLSLTATEPVSRASLTLAAYIDGVLDGAARDRAAATLSQLAIRH